MKAINTLRLAHNNVFFGPGPRALLEKIVETSSLRQATIETGISYTKALRVLRKMEQELGFAVVASEKGGNTHGGTRLTEKGEALLRAYAVVENKVQEYAQQMVEEQFSDLL